jgi:hypothetical protein
MYRHIENSTPVIGCVPLADISLVARQAPRFQSATPLAGLWSARRSRPGRLLVFAHPMDLRCRDVVQSRRHARRLTRGDGTGTNDAAVPIFRSPRDRASPIEMKSCKSKYDHLSPLHVGRIDLYTFRILIPTKTSAYTTTTPSRPTIHVSNVNLGAKRHP